MIPYHMVASVDCGTAAQWTRGRLLMGLFRHLWRAELNP